MYASIQAIEYYLPVEVVRNEDLRVLFTGRSTDELALKTGVSQRHIAARNQSSSDLAVAAARKVFDSGACRPSDLDFILLCTQTPDFFFPATACIVQEQLGVPTAAGALDFNLGCSGYIYGLGLAKALIETGQANRVLLMTADTVSRLIDPQDRALRVLIGDAATATVVEGREGTGMTELGPFVYGTDGRGAEHLIVHEGAFRQYSMDGATGRNHAQLVHDKRMTLRMNGAKIVEFSLRVVPPVLRKLLNQAQLSLDDVDLCVFHQASKYILDLLQHAMGIPQSKFYRCLADCGNTVASTIPIALRRAVDDGRLLSGSKVLLAGFGVGLSWGATIVRWGGFRTARSHNGVGEVAAQFSKG